MLDISLFLIVRQLMPHTFYSVSNHYCSSNFEIDLKIALQIQACQSKEGNYLSIESSQTYWKMNDRMSTQYQPHWSLWSLIY